MQALDGIRAFQQVQRRKLEAGMRVLKGQRRLRFGLRLFAGLDCFSDWLLDHFTGQRHGNMDIVSCGCIFQWQDVGLCQTLIFQQVNVFVSHHRSGV